jgi:antitoxin (DNA-binding transcriptional repressor) of toxin-antitoxin stability system
MDDVTLAHAKEHLEELVARAARGEEVVIRDEKLGTVKVVAVALTSVRPKRVIGQWKDQFVVPARLFEPMTDDELTWRSGELSR